MQWLTLSNAVNSTIRCNNVSNNKGSGITLSSSGGSDLSSNVVSNNSQSGISLTGSGSSSIKNNTVSNNKGSGITLSNSGSSDITANAVSNNSQSGISVTGTGSSSVKNNTITDNNLSGLRLENSGNSVSNNSASGNSIGISIYATDNILDDNEITNNAAGVLVGYNNSVIVLGRNNIWNNQYGLTIAGKNDKLNDFVIENNINGIIVNGINNTLNNVTTRNNVNAGLIFNSTSSGSLFSNGSVANNGLGIIMNGKNDSVLSSTILKNTGYGFTVNGSNNTLNYNRICQNNLGLNNTGNATDANLNWWGINNALLQVTSSGTNLNMSYWYVLQLSANNFNTTVNATQTFNAGDSINLGYSLETNVPVINNKDLLPYFEVTVTKPDGSTVNGDIRNTTVGYTITAKKGTVYSMGSAVDNEDIKLSVNTPSSDLSVKNTVNNKKPGLNEKIVYTITVTNNGPDNATGVFVKDVFPKGLKFVSADGTYNSTTGIWTIGNLSSGETAVLNILVQVIQSGIDIKNTATVYQANYDPDNTTDQSTITITVEKDSNSTNGGNSNSTGGGTAGKNVTVNAKTAALQNTGMPIVLLILAIFTVLCGILPGRK